MYFTIIILTALAALSGTKAAPFFGLENLFHHRNTTSTVTRPSTSASLSSTTYSARYPHFTGGNFGSSDGRFSLTEVLQEHKIDLSNIRQFNVTRILGELGFKVPSNFNLDNIIKDIENKFDHHHNYSRVSSTRSSITSTSSSSRRSRPTSPISRSSSSIVEPSSSSASISIALPSISASVSASASASASTSDFFSGSEIAASATISSAPSSVSASISETSSATSFISIATDEDAGIPGPTQSADADNN
ncbi:uncharacterized protein L201_007424 [Kwoniella dendrophila CBS 6074]|uniref:Effector protein n=1 Tax=Kwoniella dendrophila CBS 6074 TaxID=1295534 RepID=A0AAX4K4C6_9TREE